MQPPSVFQLRTVFRVGASTASRLLPRQASIGVERKLRGWEEARKLSRADAVIVSYAKSGRTWFRVLISHYFAHKYGLAEGRIMEFDEFHRADPAIPVLFFTHDNYLKDYIGHDRKLDHYGSSRVILLMRDPRDTAVSQYFQWRHRMSLRKKVINAYPPAGTELYEFITGEAAGIPRVIAFMNEWARDLDCFPQLLLVRYENLKADTVGELGRALRFLGEAPTLAQLSWCADRASIENMRKM
jgi:hypothetical protein